MRAPRYSDNAKEIFNPDFITNPFSLYASLRESAPISRIGNSDFYLITSWNLIKEVLDREKEFSANLLGVLYKSENGEPSCFDLSENGALDVIATADGETHARHRKILSPAFTRKSIAYYESYVRELVTNEIETIIYSQEGNCINAIEKIPALVIAALLGLPVSDYNKFIRWAMIGGSMLAGEISADELDYLAHETNRMSLYLQEKFESLMLSDERTGTLLALLREACDQGKITKDEAIGIAIIIFGAGGESTSALMGSAIFYLASQPDVQRQLRADRNLLSLFVEEVIRLSPPFRFHYRSVRLDSNLGGCDLSIGDKLMLSWDSANRDREIFREPDSFSLSRKNPKNHMGFGRGSHFCLGAMLARLEVKIMIEELINRTTDICLQNEPNYFNSIFVRRFNSLNISIKI